MNDSAPMSLDDNVTTDAMPAKDNDGVPYCRKHHCRMKGKSGGKKDSPNAYYACPVPGCQEKEKKIKTNHPGVVPPQPLCCPRCSKDKAPVYCERDPKASTPASVILKCPSCSWKSSAMVVPQLAAAHFASRGAKLHPPSANIGDR